MSARLLRSGAASRPRSFVRATCSRRFSTALQVRRSSPPWSDRPDRPALPPRAPPGRAAPAPPSALVGHGLGLLGVLQALRFVGAGARLHRFERALLRPALAQRDERRYRPRVDPRRSAETSRCRNSDSRSPRRRRSKNCSLIRSTSATTIALALPDARIASTRLAPPGVCGGSGLICRPERRLLHQVFILHRRPNRSSFRAAARARFAIAPRRQHTGIEQHHFLQARRYRFLCVEALANEDEFLGQALQLRMRIVVVPGDPVRLPGTPSTVQQWPQIRRRRQFEIERRHRIEQQQHRLSAASPRPSADRPAAR